MRFQNTASKFLGACIEIEISKTSSWKLSTQMFAFARFSGFLGNSITIVLVALLVTALFVIGLLGVLLCSRCKSSSPSMKSAESQTSQIASSFSDDLPKGKFTVQGDDNAEKKEALIP